MLFAVVYFTLVIYNKITENNNCAKTIDENNYCIVAIPKLKSGKYWYFKSGITKKESENESYCFNIKNKYSSSLVPSHYHMKSYKINDYEEFKKNNEDKCYLD